MSRNAHSVFMTLTFVFVSHLAGLAPSQAADGETKWYEGISGKYVGEVGGNADPITFEFTVKDGELTATYEIKDPQFSDKPYKGKLLKLKVVKGKERTLSYRYEDEMNNGSYTLTFSKDLKKFTGTYVIDGEEESDVNTVTATKK